MLFQKRNKNVAGSELPHPMFSNKKFKEEFSLTFGNTSKNLQAFGISYIVHFIYQN
jgi:hypothetical protein